jgi:DNA helicase II / ATP-dependent DNA helicase PcrA
LNPNDDVALARVINTPPRGIGKTTIDALLRQQKDLEVSLWETLAIAVEQRMLGPRATTSLDVFRQVIISLGERAESAQPLSETVKAATFETGYARWLQEEKSEEAEARLLNIDELGAAAIEAEKQDESLRDFIDHAALVSDTDQYKEDARVTLMTMHAAKGLEFPIVFLVGLEDGLFPSLRGVVPSDFSSDSTTEYPEPYDEQSKERLEEERRLCYVAITRAQQQLYLTNAMRRRRFYAEKAAGGSRFFDEAETRVSRFLKEIPDDLLEDISAGPSWLKFSRRPDTRHNRDAREALRGTGYSTQKTGTANKSNDSLDNVYEFLERMKGRAPSASRVSTPPRGEAESPRAKSESGKFRVGARVRHAKFGAGSVLGVEGTGDDAKITVRFDTHGIKKFMARYSKNDWR